MVRAWLCILSGVLLACTTAQFPEPPTGLTFMNVTRYPGVSMSYKQTTICETQAKAWAGFVNMPASFLNYQENDVSYNVSMFFWYVAARQDPQSAPTGIYLAGGPGQSSLYGATSDGGPCLIMENSNGTYTNEWSTNEIINMLYVDQPVGTGFSFDVLINSTQDLLSPQQTSTGIVPFDAYNASVPPENTTFKYGTFPSQTLSRPKTANTTAIAARTFWHFTQVWFSEFPEWQTCDKGVSMWGNSYGGYWIMGFGAYIQRKNEEILTGKTDGVIIDLNQVGFTNGCVDMLYQVESYPKMAYNNTYGLEVINRTIYEYSLHSLYKADGCLALIQECRKLGERYDPQEFGNNATVNQICDEATEFCAEHVIAPYILFSNRSASDMAHFLPDPFPTNYVAGFFNQEWVQRDIGVPLNFTANSAVSEAAIVGTGTAGDFVRRAGIKDLEYLLSNGVKVTLMYGDRDLRCPWLGAESLSLAANWSGAEGFRNAGYEYIATNDSYYGGVVRQHGNLSFARIFEAGHDAAPYQPETIFRVIQRAVSDRDIATGKLPTSGIWNTYSTGGPSSSYAICDELPSPPPVDCYLYSVSSTCTYDQYVALLDGTAEVVDGRIVKPAGGGGPIGAGASF